MKTIKNRVETFLSQKSSSEEFSCKRFFFYTFMFYTYFSMRPIQGSVKNFLTESNDDLWSPISFFSFFSHDFIKNIYFDGMETCFLILLLFCALGIGFRYSSILAFLFALYLLGIPMNYGKVHHSNHLPIFFMGIFSISSFSGHFSFDYLIRKYFLKKRDPKISIKYMLPFQIMLIHFSIIYFASGFQKLRHSGLDWIFSDNLVTIILTRPSFTDLGLSLSYYPLLIKFLAFMTVFIELFSPLSLLNKYLKFFFVLGVVGLHLGAYATLGAHGNFTPHVLSLSVFVPWHTWFFQPLYRQYLNFSSVRCNSK